MRSAFGDPPDSGVKASAKADGAATSIASRPAARAARSRRRGMPEGKARVIIYPGPRDAPLRGACPQLGRTNPLGGPASGPLEVGRALLHEGEHTLLKVPRARQRVL